MERLTGQAEDDFHHCVDYNHHQKENVFTHIFKKKFPLSLGVCILTFVLYVFNFKHLSGFTIWVHSFRKNTFLKGLIVVPLLKMIIPLYYPPCIIKLWDTQRRGCKSVKGEGGFRTENTKSLSHHPESISPRPDSSSFPFHGARYTGTPATTALHLEHGTKPISSSYTVGCSGTEGEKARLLMVERKQGLFTPTASLDITEG